MSDAGDVERGRAAFESRVWAEAFRLLAVADDQEPLAPADLELLATAAYLSGRANECTAAWARAHTQHLADGNVPRAAACAYWLAFTLIGQHESARAGGWVARAISLLDDDGTDCVERGYLLILQGIQALMQGEPERALSIIDDVTAVARRFRDADLWALAGLGRGQTLVALGRATEGMAILDEIMVAATAGELTETVAGLAYCAVIGTCHEIFDVRRAQEWTAALTQWCAAQPDLVPYSGHCLVHRAELHQLHGEWSAAADAIEAAHRRYALARDRASDGMAYYATAELARQQGDIDTAEQAYEEASSRGHDPQPGLALLRLSQGNIDAAAAATRRLVNETHDQVRRARVLAAHTQVMVAADDLESARVASDELSEIAQGFQAPMLHAIAQLARAVVLLADGDAAGALKELRRAGVTWRELDAPYELARTRELIAVACRELGDPEAEALELRAAAEGYEALGASHDSARVRAGRDAAAAQPTSGLTPRELEVLRLVAAGKTNRIIASDLVLSEKTVARHISNIFVKLDLPSRAAATAYAYEHGLV